MNTTSTNPHPIACNGVRCLIPNHNHYESNEICCRLTVTLEDSYCKSCHSACIRFSNFGELAALIGYDEAKLVTDPGYSPATKRRRLSFSLPVSDDEDDFIDLSNVKKQSKSTQTEKFLSN